LAGAIRASDVTLDRRDEAIAAAEVDERIARPEALSQLFT
jgi:hypothetical protein